MTDLFNKLLHYLQFPFVRYAIIVGVAVALCASLLGVVLVLKRYSHIGDGLSHIAFGAIAMATALKVMDQMLLVLPLTVLFSVLLMGRGQGARIKGDAAIAVLSVSSLAIGYLLLNAFPGSANISGDVCTTLFGSTSILTLTKSE
ncbi:MAG: metal ABC transporter permease, partial [Clostridiales bacterium]|nr:metal ABC transporter permease [Clostridiales bacterium]